MSATRPSRSRQHRHAAPPAPRDISMLRARRREADRRRRLLRVDLGAGVAVALVLLVAIPGLAIAAILAGLLLIACATSLALQWRATRRPSGAGGLRRFARRWRRRGSSRDGGAEGRPRRSSSG
jgi:Flp pilus assembly protein TadB